MDQDQNNNPNKGPWNNSVWRRWRMRRFGGALTIIIVIVILFYIFDGGHHHYSNNANGLNTIAVTGHGEVFATSTVATFSFTASDRETTVTAAQNKMATEANTAIAYLKQNAVASADIQTTDYSVNPTYADNVPVICPAGAYNCGGGTPTINGYEVSETISVKLRDPSKSGTILQGIGSSGVSNISGLTFSIDNPDALQEQAREMAINDAKAKATQLGKDLGIKLDKIVSYSDNGNNPSPLPYAQATLSAAASAPATPDIETGQNKITSDVTITYEIR